MRAQHLFNIVAFELYTDPSLVLSGKTYENVVKTARSLCSLCSLCTSLHSHCLVYVVRHFSVPFLDFLDNRRHAKVGFWRSSTLLSVESLCEERSWNEWIFVRSFVKLKSILLLRNGVRFSPCRCKGLYVIAMCPL